MNKVTSAYKGRQGCNEAKGGWNICFFSAGGMGDKVLKRACSLQGKRIRQRRHTDRNMLDRISPLGTLDAAKGGRTPFWRREGIFRFGGLPEGPACKAFSAM